MMTKQLAMDMLKELNDKAKVRGYIQWTIMTEFVDILLEEAHTEAEDNRNKTNVIEQENVTNTEPEDLTLDVDKGDKTPRNDAERQANTEPEDENQITLRKWNEFYNEYLKQDKITHFFQFPNWLQQDGEK